MGPTAVGRLLVLLLLIEATCAALGMSPAAARAPWVSQRAWLHLLALASRESVCMGYLFTQRNRACSRGFFL